MMPNGDKYNNITINGLKIFVKPQFFILVQKYFMNSFPIYKDYDRDKPVGFDKDPERNSLMNIKLIIAESLICFLNRPGFKSIACKGDIKLDIVNGNVQEGKRKYQQKLKEVEYIKKNGHCLEGVDWEKRAFNEISEVQSMKLDIKDFTPFICSLSLINSHKSFNVIKKRQLL